MIQAFRNQTQSVFFRVILFFVALTFVISFGWFSSETQKNVVATVNSEDILFQDYDIAYNQRLEQLRQTFGENAEALASQLNISQSVLDSVISRRLLLQNARKQGILVADAEVIEQLKLVPVFQKDGRFSKEVYQQLLRQNRVSPESYEKSVREDLLLQKYQRLSTARQLSTQAEVQRIYDYEQRVISVEYLRFSPEQFFEDVVIIEENLKEFYDNNSQDFMSLKKYQIEYFTFGFSDLGTQEDPSERMIERYYETNPAEFSNDDQVKARHILMKVSSDMSEEAREEKRKQLESLLQEARAGASFEELARENSEDFSAIRGGDLGWFSAGEIDETLSNAAFGLQVGEVSEIVQTGFGFHIVKLEGKKDAETKPLESVKSEIRQKLIDTRQERKLSQTLETIENQLTEGQALEEIATSLDLRVKQTDLFQAGDVIDGIGSVDDLISELDSKAKDETGKLLKNPVQGHLFFKLIDVKDPQTLPLEEVREEIERKFRYAESVKIAKTSADDLLNELEAGKDWQAIEMPTPPQSAKVSVLTAQVQGIGNAPTFQSQALELNDAQPFASVQVGDDSYLIRFISSEISLEREDEKMEEIRRRLTFVWNNIIFEREIERLRAKADIEILNPALAGGVQSSHGSQM